MSSTRAVRTRRSAAPFGILRSRPVRSASRPSFMTKSQALPFIDPSTSRARWNSFDMITPISALPPLPRVPLPRPAQRPSSRGRSATRRGRRRPRRTPRSAGRAMPGRRRTRRRRPRGRPREPARRGPPPRGPGSRDGLRRRRRSPATPGTAWWRRSTADSCAVVAGRPERVTAWKRPGSTNCSTLASASQSCHASSCCGLPTTSSRSSTATHGRTSWTDRRSTATTAPCGLRHVTTAAGPAGTSTSSPNSVRSSAATDVRSILCTSARWHKANPSAWAGLCHAVREGRSRNAVSSETASVSRTSAFTLPGAATLCATWTNRSAPDRRATTVVGPVSVEHRRERVEVAVRHGPHQVVVVAQCGALVRVLGEPVRLGRAVPAPAVAEHRDLRDLVSALLRTKSGMTPPSLTCGTSCHARRPRACGNWIVALSPCAVAVTVRRRASSLGPPQQQRAEPLLDRGVVQIRRDPGDGLDGTRFPVGEHLVEQVDRDRAADVVGQLRRDVRQQAPVTGSDAFLLAGAALQYVERLVQQLANTIRLANRAGSRCLPGRGRAATITHRSLLPAGSVASTTSRWSGSPPSTSRSPSSRAARNDARTVRSTSAIGGTSSRTAWVRSSWVSASEVHPSGSGSFRCRHQPRCRASDRSRTPRCASGTTPQCRHVSNNGVVTSWPAIMRVAPPRSLGPRLSHRISAVRSTSAPNGKPSSSQAVPMMSSGLIVDRGEHGEPGAAPLVGVVVAHRELAGGVGRGPAERQGGEQLPGVRGTGRAAPRTRRHRRIRPDPLGPPAGRAEPPGDGGRVTGGPQIHPVDLDRRAADVERRPGGELGSAVRLPRT